MPANKNMMPAPGNTKPMTGWPSAPKHKGHGDAPTFCKIVRKPITRPTSRGAATS
ncbi:hypothetical protein [Burkholderia singularis]|uniref:hypothetical protein n=1 Tax=Burkholderia singularis TaxID=1503053 RepID=UPI00159EEE01|nr:hypothetical protein [Burkholderia singularis]